MKNRYWFIILAIVVAVLLSLPSIAGKFEDAKHQWKTGLSFIKTGVMDMVHYAFACLDEDETITGNWTFEGDNTYTGTQSISSSTVTITATSIALNGDDWQDSEVADDLTLSGATVQSASVSGTLTVASGATISVDDNAKFNTPEMVIVKFGTVAAGTDDERPVFVAPCSAELTQVCLVNASAIATDAVSYTTISLVNKGSDGTANNTIASIDNSGSGTAFAAFDAVDMGTLSATYKTVSTGDVLTLKKVDTAGGQATDEMIVEIKYKRTQ